MTYDPTIPPSTTSPSLSVGDIRANFSKFFSVFSNTTADATYNHIALNDFNQGKHGAVILQKQLTDPSVIGDSVTLYAKDATSGLGTEPQLFLKIPDSSTLPNLPFQMTLNQVNIVGPQYQSFAMGSYLIYFGSTNNIAVSISLSPAPTSIVCAQAVTQGVIPATGLPYTSGVTITQPSTIKINSSNAPGGTTFLWFAIGEA